MGTGISFDIAQYNSYSKFTVDNFFTSSLENDNLHGGPVINTDNYVAIYGKTFLHKSYDVSQGVLTAKQVLEV